MMSKNILIVDDEPINRFVFSTFLLHHNYEVTCANDGLHALQLLEKELSINWILLDLNMPNLDGYGVLEALEKDEKYKFRELNIIIISASVQEDYNAKIRQMNLQTPMVKTYMNKPVQLTLLNNYLNSHK